MRTADLTGVLLSYWVAKAEGKEAKIENGVCYVLLHRSHGFPQYAARRYHDDWKHGGPIIDKFDIAIVGGERNNSERKRHAFMGDGTAHCYGPDNLTAAMRAYVASKFGDQVPEVQLENV